MRFHWLWSHALTEEALRLPMLDIYGPMYLVNGKRNPQWKWRLCGFWFAWGRFYIHVNFNHSEGD